MFSRRKFFRAVSVAALASPFIPTLLKPDKVQGKTIEAKPQSQLKHPDLRGEGLREWQAVHSPYIGSVNNFHRAYPQETLTLEDPLDYKYLDYDDDKVIALWNSRESDWVIIQMECPYGPDEDGGFIQNPPNNGIPLPDPKIRGVGGNYIIADDFQYIDPETYNKVVKGFVRAT